MKNFDITIVGAGPAGLCFAASLAERGLKIAIIEKQSEETLAAPLCDGRDTAITPLTKNILNDLGVWDFIPTDAISEIKQAKVLNGTSLDTLDFNAGDVGKPRLGFIISNHLVRKAAYENAKKFANISYLTGVTAIDAHSDDAAAYVTLSDGAKLTSKLLVAADSRFSTMRHIMGIGTHIENFGKNILVAQMKIEKPHNHIAFECFYYGHTLAILPLLGDKCSIVMTLKPNEATRFANLPEAEFNAEIQNRFSHKYGAMNLVGERHTYPLVSVYANNFVSKCFALIGDAAVGMHPVTAHGFNFGIQGQHTLANEIKNAHQLGIHIGSYRVLKAYERNHKMLTKPLYLATNGIVKLFTNDAPIARHARGLLLNAANYAFPIKNLIVSSITKENAKKRSFAPLSYLLKKVF